MRGSQSVADAGILVKKKSKFSKMKSALGLKKKDKGRATSTADGLGLSQSFNEEPDFNKDRGEELSRNTMAVIPEDEGLDEGFGAFGGQPLGRRSTVAAGHFERAQTMVAPNKERIIPIAPSTPKALEKPETVKEEKIKPQKEEKNHPNKVLKKDWQQKDYCQVCYASFTKMTFRPHHCRMCGRTCCNDCSDKRAVDWNLHGEP